MKNVMEFLPLGTFLLNFLFVPMLKLLWEIRKDNAVLRTEVVNLKELVSKHDRILERRHEAERRELHNHVDKDRRVTDDRRR